MLALTIRGSAQVIPTDGAPPGQHYAPVFHPGATDIRAAATIALGVSEERGGVDVVIQLVPTATISGTISAPSGALPQLLSVRLVPAGGQTEMLAGAGLRGLATQPGANGTYVFTGVAPGAYTIKANIGSGRGAPPNTPTQWAAADVNVSGQDLEVPLTLQPSPSTGASSSRARSRRPPSSRGYRSRSCRQDRAAPLRRAAAAAWMRMDVSRSPASRPTRINS
jgi:hypothetical protein